MEARTARPRDGFGEGQEERPSDERQQPVLVGLLAAPGLAHDLAQQLSRELPGLLTARFPDHEWQVVVRTEPLAAASDSDVDLVEIAHRRLLAEGWRLAICLTDYPVHVGSRPVTAHASATHGVGLVSVPALGAVNVDRRVRRAVLRLIEGLLGESVDDPARVRDRRRHLRMRGRLEELASPVGHAEVAEGPAFRFVTDVARGNLRLLIGMVRANRPYRLIVGLSRTLAAAMGLDIFGVVSPGVWILANGLSWWRLVIVSVASVLITCVSLIAAHGLWEKTASPRPEARERVVLFNLATSVTVALGIVTLYLALFVINVAAAAVLITPGVLSSQIHQAAGLSTYLALAAVVSSLATLGGALGAALENDRAVREAAYGYHPDERTEAEPATSQRPGTGGSASGARRGRGGAERVSPGR